MRPINRLKGANGGGICQHPNLDLQKLEKTHLKYYIAAIRTHGAAKTLPLKAPKDTTKSYGAAFVNRH